MTQRNSGRLHINKTRQKNLLSMSRNHNRDSVRVEETEAEEEPTEAVTGTAISDR